MVCPICLAPVAEDRTELHCDVVKHVFCTGCIRSWWEITFKYCPLCKSVPKRMTKVTVQNVTQPRVPGDPDAFEIEYICGVRQKHGCIEYKVSWKGHEGCTWEEHASKKKDGAFSHIRSKHLHDQPFNQQLANQCPSCPHTTFSSVSNLNKHKRKFGH